MITVCLADNYPVVHFGIKSYFKDHPEIDVVSNVGNFFMVPDALRNKEIDVLVIDLEIDGLKSIFELKAIVKSFPKTKVLIFTSLNEQIYAPNAIKAGVAGYVHKTSKLETLGTTIIRVNQGLTVLSETLKRNLALLSKQDRNERIYKKLSNREIEVLRYLCEGRKNNEISKILDLNEKTISTYKLRLQQKLDVSNLVDLVKKAKTLDIS
jgi:two-component system response regulator FimZ (fimbrial Z protein)